MKYHIWTEGCQMNVADSRRLASALEKMDCEPTRKPEEADIIVLNTCVVRQSAEDKAIGRLSSLRPLKDKNPDLVINVMGCLIGVRGNQKILEKFPWVDVASPPSDPQPLLHFLVERSAEEKTKSKQMQLNAILDEDIILPKEEQGRLVSAYIPIVYGCSHACTYCVIPSRRGIEQSRPYAEILNEAQSLAEQGVKEITLLGQIVDRYGLDLPEKPTLANLLRDLHQIKSLKRIRFLTSHPNWMTDDLLEAVAALPKVCPHIEVPIQAGDDDILKAMRRGYTADDYRRLIGNIRERIPGVAIATDIIVGFPGETKTQFQKTFDLLEELKMDVAHLARYSVRPGTYAARKMEDNVSEEEKMRRFRLLEDLQEKISDEINAKLMGETVNVLFEEKSKGRWRGRTSTNKLVFVESHKDLRGQEKDVRITWTGPWSMIGTLEE
ncbi:MAG: tRNA (N6-isopentenyl adenosine(37)-C2)-methylthiotransferase MiaB [Chloroflexota bacterium]|jgi:tRNA-2-methylthio-N6-dimethylallyladenosine synthase|nr:tRNA (N6-isopentenyl adenosine(37)-C2)-methylthiotransferase MiaB [Chloroflexota bacterium]